MSAISCTERFAQVPVELISGLRKGTAFRIVSHLLSLCNLKKPEFWIDQRIVGQELGIHRDTVGRWVRYLEKNGYFQFLGFTGYGGRKRYRLVPTAKKPQEKILPALSKTAGSIQAGKSEGFRQIDRNINRIERTNIKEQTVVDLSKKEFSSNEKIALKQKLKTIGLHKQVIDKFMSKYSIEKINAQIEHLQLVIERGGSIEKPAAWLISAIERNYTLPKEQSKNTLENEKEADAVRRATVMAQAAKSELIAGNLREALELSTQSALIAENGLAKEVHNETQHLLERAQEIEKARQLVSAETLALIRHEEEQKKLKEMQRWGKSEAQILASTFFKGAVEALVNQRLLAAV